LTPLVAADLRAALVAVALYYLSGLPLARTIARAEGGSVAVWSFPCSLAVLLSGLFLAQIAGLSLRQAGWVIAGCVVAAGVLSFWIDRRGRRGERPGPASLAARGHDAGSPAPVSAPRNGSGGVRPLEWAIVAASTLVLLVVGGPLNYLFDSLDHITGIRRSLLSDQILPTDVFYRGGDGAGWDPRKGFLHPLHAVVCLAGGVDPLHLWRVLPAVLAPGVLLAVSRFLGVWTTSASGRRDGWRPVAALLLWVVAGSGAGALRITKSGYPNHVAYPLAFFAAGLLLLELVGTPRRARRVGIALLGFAGTLIHLVAGALCLLSAGFVVLAALLGPRAERREGMRRAVLAGTAAAVGVLPALFLRLAVQGEVLSTLHTHPQGLLMLGRGLLLISPFYIYDQAGVLAVLALPLLPLALASVPPDRRLALGIFTAVPWICLITPLFTPLYHALGYLVGRFLLVAPAAAVVVLAAEAAWRRLRAPRRPLGWLYAATVLLALALFLGDAFRDTPGAVRQAARQARGEDTPHSFAGALAAIPRLAPGRAVPPVVLADPFTSYAISACTGAHVVATLNQHSPPTDARWRSRREDQKEMMLGTWGEARVDSLLAAHGVDVIFANTALPVPLREYGTEVDSAWIGQALRRLEADPERFPPLYRGPDGLVCLVRGASDAAGRRGSARPDGGAGALPGTDERADPGQDLPDVRPAAAVGPPGAFPDGSAAPPAAAVSGAPGSDTLAVAPGPFRYHGIEAIGVTLPARPISRPRLVRIPLAWRRYAEVDTDLPLRAHLRISTEVPRHWFYREAWSKPARHVAQRLDGQVYRLRTGVPPLRGARDLARLPLGVAFPDTLAIMVPPWAAPGEWKVTLAVLEDPYIPNLRLDDLLHDRDSYEGEIVGRLTVLP